MSLLSVTAYVGWVQGEAVLHPPRHARADITSAPSATALQRATVVAQPALVRTLDPAPTVLAINPDCPLPPVTGYHQLPLQTPLPAGMRNVRMANGTVRPLAGFSVDARVLSAKHYSGDQPSRFSPVDLALGWGPMTDSITLTQLNVRQSGRWYRYGWMGDPPLDQRAIIRNSANMHMIASNADIRAALLGIHRDDWVRIDGWLVEVHDVNGWNWRSSLTRDDTGEGGCEVIHVCRVSRY